MFIRIRNVSIDENGTIMAAVARLLKASSHQPLHPFPIIRLWAR